MDLDVNRLHGIIPPLITPFDSEGNINLVAMDQLTGRLLEAGVQAIFVAGTTGEAAGLTVEELAALTEAAVKAVAGQIPVLVGVTAPSLRLTLQRVEAVTKAGATALVAHTPYYYPHTQNEIYYFYKELAAASTLPILLYNIPQTTKVPIANQVILQLAGEEAKIIGYKDSSPNLTDLRDLIHQMQEVRPNFRFFLGSDILQDVALKIGAHGTIPSLANLFPEVVVQAYWAFREEKWAEGNRLVKQIIELTRVYSAGKESVNGNIVAGLKYGLTLKGIAAGEPRPPLMALDAEGQAKVKAIVEMAWNYAQGR